MQDMYMYMCARR